MSCYTDVTINVMCVSDWTPDVVVRCENTYDIFGLFYEIKHRMERFLVAPDVDDVIEVHMKPSLIDLDEKEFICARLILGEIAEAMYPMLEDCSYEGNGLRSNAYMYGFKYEDDGTYAVLVF